MIARHLLGVALLAGALTAQEPPTPPIADNSFLIEEAYNQDPGVVQHISTFSRPGLGPGGPRTMMSRDSVRSIPRSLRTSTVNR